MRGHLLGSNGLEQSLHVAVVGHDQGVLAGVVGVNIACLKLFEFILIVGLAVEFLVLDFGTKPLFVVIRGTYAFFWTLLIAAVRAS
jgi:hypothetical protein